MQRDVSKIYSMCGMCSVRCPIEVHVKDGKIVWIQGNPNDKTMGTSLCAKGSSALSLEYMDDDRPKGPMIRDGERGSGKWREVSWDEALDYVGNKLKEIIEKYGGKGVILSDRGGPFSDFRKAFLRAIGSPNYTNHDTLCRRNIQHASLSLFGLAHKKWVFDIANTKHIVLYGRNICETLQVKEVKQFINALDKGAKCTYIDPRVTITASKATRYWQIRPNTDYALNLSLLNVILYNELYDKEFVNRWVIGLDEIKEKVKDYTPKWQENITGISEQQVYAFIDEITKDAPHVIFHPGWMTARNTQSFYFAKTVYMLNVLLGAIEVPGGLVLSKGAKDAGTKGLNDFSSRIPAPKDPRLDGCGWKYKQFDKGPGLLQLMLEAIDKEDPYKVGALIAYRHDPISSLPDPNEVRRILNKLELLVAVDVRFSEFAWFSDVILPDTTFLERSDPLVNKGGLKPCFMIRQQAVEPRFNTRPGWWIITQLAKRVGAGEYFNFDSIEDVWNYQLEGTGVLIEDIKKTGIYNLSDKPIFYDRENGLKFNTPSGKIEFISEKLKEVGAEQLAQFNLDILKKSDDEFYLLFGRASYFTHCTNTNDPLLNELMPENVLWINSNRAKKLGISDGDEVLVSRLDVEYKIKAKVTDFIHEEAVFLIRGFGKEVPAQRRVYKRGVSDQHLQRGMLLKYDPLGGGIALCETTVKVKKAD